MKTHFHNFSIPPVTAEQLRSVGVDPSYLYWSPTFNSWCLSGPVIVANPYHTTGALLHKLGLTPNPEA